MLHTALPSCPQVPARCQKRSSTLRNHSAQAAGLRQHIGYPWDSGRAGAQAGAVGKACMDQHYLDASARLRLVTASGIAGSWLNEHEADPQPAAACGDAAETTTARVRIIAFWKPTPQLLHATLQDTQQLRLIKPGFFTDFKRLREALQQALPDALVNRHWPSAR